MVSGESPRSGAGHPRLPGRRLPLRQRLKVAQGMPIQHPRISPSRIEDWFSFNPEPKLNHLQPQTKINRHGLDTFAFAKHETKINAKIIDRIWVGCQKTKTMPQGYIGKSKLRLTASSASSLTIKHTQHTQHIPNLCPIMPNPVLKQQIFLHGAGHLIAFYGAIVLDSFLQYSPHQGLTEPSSACKAFNVGFRLWRQ